RRVSALQVSATDPDCGVNAMVNYTLGEGFGRGGQLEVRSGTGELCVAGELDYEARSSFEFPVIATDRGGLSTTAMVKVQLTDVNDNVPTFYPRTYNVSLPEGGGGGGGGVGVSASQPVVAVVATDPDSGKFGAVSYRIVAGDAAGLFRVDRSTGEIFVTQPGRLVARSQHRINVSATDGGGLRAPHDAEVFLSVSDASQRPPIFQHPRYTFSVREDAPRHSVVGSVKASSSDVGSRSSVRYSIYSGDPDGYFSIEPVLGTVATAAPLDHELHQTLLLNVQATSGDPPVYGHTQVNIVIEDVNDNAPEFDSSTVRISVPESLGLGVPLYAAHARDRDTGRNGAVRYRLAGAAPGAGAGAGAGSPAQPLFAIEPRLGHLTLARHLDYETATRHAVVVVATDSGEPPLSASLSVLLEVQDVNDNPPVFERAEYAVSVLESLPVNSQVVQVTAVDLDTGNNARLTYRLLANGTDHGAPFGVFPNSGWIYLRAPLDREARDRYLLTVAATDNGSPASSATTRVLVTVLDANDNEPRFSQDAYHFSVEENLPRGAHVGQLSAADADLGANAAVRYYLIPANSSFHVNPVTGEVVTREPLDREARASYELVAEARDQGAPARSSRVAVRVRVADVNDCSPELVDPREDVVSVREEQPPGTEVGRVRAVDRDDGANASVTYSLLTGRDSDGAGVFSVDPVTGVIRTRAVLDHEERAIYRLAVAATDGGKPPRQAVRLLRVEVLHLNDNRPTFTSSSLVFRVREDVPVGHVVGTVAPADGQPAGPHVTYTLSQGAPGGGGGGGGGCFDMDRATGALVVARQLDRETQAEYRLEVRALDTSSSNNPQSSAVSVRVEVVDVNDNAPRWPRDPVTVLLSEDVPAGSAVWNLSASDADAGANGELRYSLVRQLPAAAAAPSFTVDALTGTLTLEQPLDYEALREYTLVIRATDQAANRSERLAATVTARVVVRDANDNSPEFVSPAASAAVAVAESAAAGALVCHVLAVDRDAGDNGRVSYSLSAGGGAGDADAAAVFALDRDSGALRLRRPLASLPAERRARGFALDVTAADAGSPPRVARRPLRVAVAAAGRAPPRFLRAAYAANVSEDAAVGAFVARVAARGGGGGGGNVTYEIPAGVADDRFAVDARTGVVRLRAALDREQRASYTLPVYASAAAPGAAGAAAGGGARHGALFDVATLRVYVTDVNDHAPEFSAGACYPLSVPENSELAAIHTVVAFDRDEGPNARITYSITGGNAGNRFSVDSQTGQLVARPLDREAQARYWLTLAAHDGGRPALSAACNISVSVEDLNDNDPRFSQPRYDAALAEDAPPGTAVLTVAAADADLGANGRVSYSLANESHWLFRIDNRTGVISTAGLFDYERQRSYSFQVVATDGGRYDARSTRVPVTVSVSDVNDNAPAFTSHPFTAVVPAYTQPGHVVVRLTAEDADAGANGEVVFGFAGAPPAKFRVNPNTGVVTAADSLAGDAGRLLQLHVLARDKGNPPRSSAGLVEVRVADAHGAAAAEPPSLRFHNASYYASVVENAAPGTEVVQVSAVRADGRRHNIAFSLAAGNEDGAFAVDAGSGAVVVRDPAGLDFEARSPAERRLVVAARSEAHAAYCPLVVALRDANDNEPRFTQPQYWAAVWEGNSKGTFVVQVSATDADSGANGQLQYHIADGNHDNAFVIEPAFSGVVKTNIVLDREIRDAYRLTVIATDGGSPQLTGTATIRVAVVDVNDNQPTFPPHSVITVSEGTEVGAVLTAVTANDVDTNPPLTYSLEEQPGAEGFFSVDRFSGRVTLVRRLDFEQRRQFRLRVAASDTAHRAATTLTVSVSDVNDNAPVFSRAHYEATLPDVSEPSRALLTLAATDADSGQNAAVRFSLAAAAAARGFSVDEARGTLYANGSAAPAAPHVTLLVAATDAGRPPLSAVAAVRVSISRGPGGGPRFAQDEYRVHVREDAPAGTTVARVAPPEGASSVVFSIVDGDEDGVFHVTSPSGDVVLLKRLDRESVDSYSLRVAAGERGAASENGTEAGASVLVLVAVDDANDNAPEFGGTDARGGYEASVSEAAPVGRPVVRVRAADADQAGGPNADLTFEITSGDDAGLFALDARSGELTVQRPLDYDVGPAVYNLVVRVTDGARPPLDAPLSTLAPVRVVLLDENDNEPRFPVAEYLEFVAENEPAGTAVFTARATDLDRGEFGRLNYSLAGAPDDAGRLFRVDAATGLVTAAAAFDYEARSRYAFSLRATDRGGKAATVRVRVEVESRDEFHPQFTERTYRFALPAGRLPVGYVVGHVAATDRDKGPDGRVVYQLTTQHPYFKVNRTTGAVTLKKKLDDAAAALEAGRDISLVVTASSGRQGSLTNMTVVEIALDPRAADVDADLATPVAGGGGGADAGGGAADGGGGGSGSDAAVSAAAGGLADWALGLLIALVLLVLAFGAVFLFLHVRNRRHKKVNKPALSGGASVGGSADGFVDPSAFDTIPIRGSGAGGGGGAGGVVQGPASPFGPPKYDEIPPYVGAVGVGVGPVVHRNNNNSASSNSGAATTSELSGSEQSGSSGRGSAEDGEDVEDEEIRMINEGPLQRDSGIHHRQPDDDNLSDVSVHNTQEYLARLGIVDTAANTAGAASASSRRCSDAPVAAGGAAGSAKDGGASALLHHQGVGVGVGVVPIDMFDEEAAGEADIANLIYAKLNDVGGGAGSERGGAGGPGGSGAGGGGGGGGAASEDGGAGSTAGADPVMVMGGFAGTHQPSMTGSLSSIVHSEEELTGSYNWDYLLDWGPQYQPLAHVFSEIARLKDDTASVQSTNSGASGGGGGGGSSGASLGGKSGAGSSVSKAPAPPPPPPLLTSVAPRSIAAPVLASRSAQAGAGAGAGAAAQAAVPAHHQLLLLPRSPISHDASGSGFSTSAAMSPSFSPSLSPLATRSPSISPLVTPGVPTAHHVVSLPRQQPLAQPQRAAAAAAAILE
ncbi:protein dachsous-like, partial [Schistocerca cancellata]|uniref:protein dachsous-like n=1 Tax=Schistocerca cancellata TaxID=274614 RepID=UPI0021193E03